MTGPLAPLRGAILVGGSSRRMGRAKAVIRHRGVGLAQRAFLALQEHARPIVLSGRGDVPVELRNLRRVEDARGMSGPLAGIAGLFEHDPGAAWIVCACDMPFVSSAACAWLTGERDPKRLAILPRPPGGRPEPLLAIYEPGARGLILPLVARAAAGPSALVGEAGVVTPRPPASLAAAWRDVDTPEDLAALDDDVPRGP